MLPSAAPLPVDVQLEFPKQLRQLFLLLRAQWPEQIDDPLFVFGREVLPIISVRTAVAVSELVVEEEVTKVVCPLC